MVERYGRTDWGRIFVMAAATFGTFLTTFAVVLNNHVTAAVTTLIGALCRGAHLVRRPARAAYFVVAGLFAAFTAADELPALSFFALFGRLLWKAPRQTLLAYRAGGAGRRGGAFRHELHRPRQLAAALHAPRRTEPDPTTGITSIHAQGGRGMRTSYWTDPQGSIKAEPSVAVYALNALVGHHGIFSLTPLWLLAVPGVCCSAGARDYRLRDLALLIGGVTIVCTWLLSVRRQAAGPQLRRHDERASLGLLDGAAVAGGGVAGGRHGDLPLGAPLGYCLLALSVLRPVIRRGIPGRSPGYELLHLSGLEEVLGVDVELAPRVW